jgi:hypothetical protein
MIQYVRLAFIEKGTEHMDRIYYAWLLTFICRLWLSWIIKTPKEELDGIQSQFFDSGSSKPRRKSKRQFFDSGSSKPRQKSKRQFFITNPAYMVSLQTYHLFRAKLMIDISFMCKSRPRRKHLFFSE